MMKQDQDNKHPLKTRQQFLTVASGKRLIARGVMALPSVVRAWEEGTIVVLAGTTNGYVVEECLKKAKAATAFAKTTFVRGVTTAPGRKVPKTTGAYGDNDPTEGNPFPGDLVMERGVPCFGKTIFDVASGLKAGDVVLKGANAVQLTHRQAGILIGHPEMGTIGPILQAVVGRRVGLVLPVGLEKRVEEDLHELARLMNAPATSGVRLLPVAGEIVTEIDALRLLTGVEARLVAAGGVCGAEGGVWLALTGTESKLEFVGNLLREIASEPVWEA